MARIETSDARALGVSGGARSVRLTFAVALGLVAMVLVALGIQAAQREPTCGGVTMGPGDTCEVGVQQDGSFTTYPEGRAEDQDASQRFLVVGGLSAVCAAGLVAAGGTRRPSVSQRTSD
jgi:hypothetical protein